jgi:hypothetical protein
MTSYAGGLNFNRDLNKDTKLTSSYFYNHLDRNVSTDLNRTNFFGPPQELIRVMSLIKQAASLAAERQS